MRRLAFILLFVFVSWLAPIPAASIAQSQSSAAAQPTATDADSQPPQPKAVPATQKTPAKVWTNDDIEVMPNSQNVPVAGAGANTKKVSTSLKSVPQERDPAWYRKQLVPLSAEIDRLDAQIAKLKAFLSGENVSEPPTMHRQLVPSPQDQLKQMEAKRQADETRMDDLLDRARHNGIEPGALR